MFSVSWPPVTFLFLVLREYTQPSYVRACSICSIENLCRQTYETALGLQNAPLHCWIINFFEEAQSWHGIFSYLSHVQNYL